LIFWESLVSGSNNGPTNLGSVVFGFAFAILGFSLGGPERHVFDHDMGMDIVGCR
jgi:hypothetical protein